MHLETAVLSLTGKQIIQNWNYLLESNKNEK